MSKHYSLCPECPMFCRKAILIAFAFLCFGLSQASAQSPTDAILMPARQACVYMEGSFASFDEYWEGEMRRSNQTIATVQRRSLMPMLGVGILDNLNVFAGLPYVATRSTEPNGGKFAGVSGLQDLSLAVKYRWLNLQIDSSKLSALATVGFSTPIGNYLADYQPYSLGLGAPELSYRGIVEYEFSNRAFLRGSGAYLWRGYAKAEREYYYNEGSYYTPWMDVPSAYTFEAVVGKWFADNKLRLELNFTHLRSLSGDDIRSYAAPQPTNRVDLDRVGVFAQYFIQPLKGLAFVGYHNRVIHGRNAGAVNTTGLGVSYFFNYAR